MLFIVFSQGRQRCYKGKTPPPPPRSPGLRTQNASYVALNWQTVDCSIFGLGSCGCFCPLNMICLVFLFLWCWICHLLAVDADPVGHRRLHTRTSSSFFLFVDTLKLSGGQGLRGFKQPTRLHCTVIQTCPPSLKSIGLHCKHLWVLVHIAYIICMFCCL